MIDADGPHPTFPPSRFLWVGALRRSVRRRDISKMFEPICGPENIVNIHIGMTEHPAACVRLSSFS